MNPLYSRDSTSVPGVRMPSSINNFKVTTGGNAGTFLSSAGLSEVFSCLVGFTPGTVRAALGKRVDVGPHHGNGFRANRW